MAEHAPTTGNANYPTAYAPNEGPRHHWWPWVLAVVLLVGGIILMTILGRHKPKPPPPRPVAIVVTNVALGDIDVAVTGLGSVLPVATVALSPRVDGQLMEVDYKEGQMVESNQLLAVIDPRPYEALLTETQGQLERDKPQLEVARIDLQRYQSAYAKKAIPEQTMNDQAAVVHQDEGTVKYDEGQVANSKVQLAYCYVRSPIFGRVGLRLVDAGNVVHAANTNAMVVITQLQPITVVFNVAEDDLPQIQEQLRVGSQMKVEALDRSQEHVLAVGRFLTLDNEIDVSTGTIKIRAIFPNEDGSLFPSQFVNARLIVQTLHDQVLIPRDAVQRNAQGTFVYLVQTNEVTMRNIATGMTDGATTSVEQGLQPGDVIAMDNFNKLGEGVKVSTRTPGEEPPTPEGSPMKGKGKGKGRGKKKEGSQSSS